jgi:hypothetical protein
MKTEIRRRQLDIFLVFGIWLIATFCLFAEDPREVFRRLKELAHPLPEIEEMKELPLVPFAEQQVQSFFYNIPTTVDEVGQYQMQNESSIAVNPKNPKILIASAVDYRDTSAAWVYFSTDGGHTWRNKKLGRPYPNWRSSNDPSVAYSYDGVGYVVYGAFGNVSDTGQLFGENGVFLARTFDECKTWEAHIPIIVHRGVQTLDSAFEDKYYITVDNSPNSPYRGNLYVPWKRVIPKDSSTQIVISKSTDKGTTWSVPLAISPRKSGSSEDTTFGQSFPLATVGPNGEVYVVWNYGIEKGIGFAKSTDGGNTFTPPKIIFKYNPFGKPKYITNQGYRHTVKEKVRAEAYPSIVCDYTGGPRNGYLYLCWSADSIPNVYFSYSKDGGESWSAPKIVHSETKNDQFWQWIAIDPTNGNLAIMYLDSRRDPENILTECWVSYSSDGGETWVDRPVSEVAMDLRLNPFTDNSFAGDYSGCAFYGGKIFPSWVDMRNSVKNIFDSDVYTAYIDINTPNPPENFVAKTIPEEQRAIQLSWETPKSKVFGHPLNADSVKYILKREGSLIRILPSLTTNFKDTGLIPYKYYTYSIAAILGSDTSVEVFSSAYAGGAKNLSTPNIVSKEAVNGSTTKICVSIPGFRIDSTTPIVNLSKLLVFDREQLLYEVPLSISDTGKTLCVDFPVEKSGFYRVRTKIEDTEGNQSDFSNEIIAFKGELVDVSVQNYYDDFSIGNPRKYLKINGWDYTTNFFFSQPSSITDSPQGNYPNRTEMILGTYPFRFEASDVPIQITFRNAAIIHRTDTGYVELVNDAGKSITVARYNMTDYEPWQDKMLNQSDWRLESIFINPLDIYPELGNEFLYLRFRLESGTLGVDDGWYIDNLSIIQKPTIVEWQSAEEEISITPNPTDRYFKLVPGMEVDRVKIYDVFGNSFIVSTLYRSESESLFDVSSLPNGVYFVEIPTRGNVGRNFIPLVIRK